MDGESCFNQANRELSGLDVPYDEEDRGQKTADSGQEAARMEVGGSLRLDYAHLRLRLEAKNSCFNTCCLKPPTPRALRLMQISKKW